MTCASPTSAALALLLDKTDLCSSVMTCGEVSSAKVRRRAARCPPATAEVTRRAQSLFGMVRRMYAAALHQHPSLSMDLQVLLREPPVNMGARGARPTVELVPAATSLSCLWCA